MYRRQCPVITNSHGIKGEVKVFPTTDDIKRFDYLEEAVIDTGKEYINVNVTGVKYFKNSILSLTCDNIWIRIEMTPTPAPIPIDNFTSLKLHGVK